MGNRLSRLELAPPKMDLCQIRDELTQVKEEVAKQLRNAVLDFHPRLSLNTPLTTAFG